MYVNVDLYEYARTYIRTCMYMYVCMKWQNNFRKVLIAESSLFRQSKVFWRASPRRSEPLRERIKTSWQRHGELHTYIHTSLHTF